MFCSNFSILVIIKKMATPLLLFSGYILRIFIKRCFNFLDLFFPLSIVSPSASPSSALCTSSGVCPVRPSHAFAQWRGNCPWTTETYSIECFSYFFSFFLSAEKWISLFHFGHLVFPCGNDGKQEVLNWD